MHIINYYQEGFGYQENFFPYYQSINGCDVVVITSDYYFPFPDYDETMLEHLGDRHVGAGAYSEKGVKIVRKKSYFAHIRFPGLIYFNPIPEIDKFKPDIVHIHGATNTWFLKVAFYKAKYKYKIFVDNHQDFMVESYNIKPLYNCFYYIWRFIYHNLGIADKVCQFLPITKSSQDWLKLRIGINSKNTMIVPLGVDTDAMFYKKKYDQEFRSQYDAADKIVIVNAGKQYKEKNILSIIEVAIRVSDLGANVLLVLVGNAHGKYKSYIDNKLLDLGADNYVRLPFQDRSALHKIYCASDVGIWPGIPSITIQEAMACRVAIIVPNNEIVGHLVDNNGCYISNNNMDEVSKYIFELSGNSSYLENQKIRSQEIAEQYSWKNIVNDLNNIYEQY